MDGKWPYKIRACDEEEEMGSTMYSKLQAKQSKANIQISLPKATMRIDTKTVPIVGDVQY